MVAEDGPEEGAVRPMWDGGNAYDRFMGRWSRLLAVDLVQFTLDRGGQPGRWLDVGAGTGSVTAAALEAGVGHVDAVEPSPAFAESLVRRFTDRPVTVHAGSATDLPPGRFDVVISSLVLNFTPDLVASLTALRASLSPGGLGVVSVWDLSDPRSFLWRFWAAVEEVQGGVSPADERYRWPVCTPAGLHEVAAESGWDPTVTAFDIATPFTDADDLWLPFLQGAGPVGSWLAGRPDAERDSIRDVYVTDMIGPDGATTPPVSTALVITAG